MTTLTMVYLLIGCWFALGLSFYGRRTRKGNLGIFIATCIVALWWVLVLVALFDLFDEALTGDISTEGDARG